MKSLKLNNLNIIFPLFSCPIHFPREKQIMDATTTTASATPPSSNPYSRKNPYLAEITSHEHLTLNGSEKDTRHFVINLGESGLTYTPGDSLGTFARNPPPIVDEVIRLLGFD